MRTLLKLTICVFLLMICSCSKYWYQEGKTFDECRQDRAACFEELKKRSDFSGLTMDYEFQFMDDCMCGKGYREVGKGELPVNVKRQEPDSSLHWRVRGIAGSLEKEE